MRAPVTIVACILALLGLCVLAVRSQDPFSDPVVRKFVTSKLATMTLKEKIGQMTQLDISYFLQKDKDGKPVAALDVNLLTQVVKDYGIGSIANTPFAASSLPTAPGGTLVSGFNVTQWIDFTNAIQKIALSAGNSSVPILYYIDHIHGANYVYGATLFPHNIGLAATWNPALVSKAAAITAKDSRTANLPVVGSPLLDVGLNPLWPAIFGTFGEDPYLISQMTAAAVAGLQGNGSLSVTGPRTTTTASILKHFIGAGDPISGKSKSTSWIASRMLKRYFLPPFEAALAAGAPGVMVGAGSINGRPIHASSDLLQTLLRGSLNFTGLIASGPNGIDDLRTLHHVAQTPEQAITLALQAGIELSMSSPGADLSFAETLYNLAQASPTLQKVVEQASGNVLALKKILGLFDNPFGSLSNPNIATVGSNADASFAIQVARESVTLLKNDGILPINSTFKNIVLSGPTGNTIGGLSGAYTFHEAGAGETEWSDYTFASTLLVNINQLASPGATVSFSLGCNFTHCPQGSVDSAYSLAQKADLLILTVGENTIETTNIDSLELSSPQQYLLRNLSSLGKPMIIVLVEGRPRILPPSVVQSANAIVHAYLPGPQGGQAVAEVLWGVTNPSGRLPYTYHERTGDTRVPYYHTYSDPGMPLYQFGYGLSFTSFVYSNLQLSAQSITLGSSIGVSVTVANTGKRAGLEVVQLYLSDVYASISPEVKMLRRFTKVNITAGQSVHLQFTLDANDMTFIGIDDAPTIEPGEFVVSVGGLQASFNVTGPAAADESTLEQRRRKLFDDYERKKQALDLELKRQIAALEDDTDVVHV